MKLNIFQVLGASICLSFILTVLVLVLIKIIENKVKVKKNSDDKNSQKKMFEIKLEKGKKLSKSESIRFYAVFTLFFVFTTYSFWHIFR